MSPLSQFRPSNIRFLFTDIDDTLTDDGKLGPESYQALWDLYGAGIHVIPITGRPAGWCEMIARFWPVAGVVGENGGFYFRLVGTEMRRHFYFDESTQKHNRSKLLKIEDRLRKEVPGCKIASDQFSRLMDLAVDFAEDIRPPLPPPEVEKIVRIFESEGAVAKVSSIHVNGWFGQYDKLSMCRTLMKNEFQLELESINETCVFVGDSPNDEPMFGFFKNSIGVANVQSFVGSMKLKPQYLCQQPGGHGFSEAVSVILSGS